MRHILALVSTILAAACSTTIGGQTGEELKRDGGVFDAGKGGATPSSGGASNAGRVNQTSGASGVGGSQPNPPAADAALSDATPAPADAASRDGSTQRDAGLRDATARTCDGSSCFCENLTECIPTEERTPRPLGSTGRRICGAVTKGGDAGGRFCRVTGYGETEGGVAGFHCEVPLGTRCDSFVPGPVSPYCDQVLNCNMLMQSCPRDLLDCERPAECLAQPPSVDACCAGYAVIIPTGKCGCICPDTTVVPPFQTLAECKAACAEPSP
jgi:hypothetical protein